MDIGTDMRLNRGMAYDLVNATGAALRIRRDGADYNSQLSHSDGSTGSEAQGKVDGTLRLTIPLDGTSGFSIVAGDIETPVNTAGPVTERLLMSAINDLTIIDGLIFSRNTPC